MVGGVICQMVVMVLYSLLLAETVYRFLTKRPVKPFRFRKTQEIVPVSEESLSAQDVKNGKILITAMVFSTIVIFVRSIYRTIELLQGWDGEIISNEALFVILDAVMVNLAMTVFNVIHPGKYLPRETVRDREAGLSEKNTLPGNSMPMSQQSSRTFADQQNGLAK